jgi:uncharacterized protein (TIGR01777 family)
MRILISGATGFVGQALCESLRKDGHELAALARRPEQTLARVGSLSTAFAWDAAAGEPPAEALAGIDAVIHLAGEPVVGLWTQAKREAIRSSRVDGTRRLVDGLNRLDQPPRVFISASAIGYYGDRGDEALSEDSPPGEGFLSEVSVAWEQQARRAEQSGLRALQLRIGIVLEAGGGALGAMLTPAKLGLGGPLGSGRQWWSWIHRDDLVGLIRLALENDSLHGPLNATAPAAARQKDFARTLGRVLRRPAFLPAPAFALRALLGGFSDELLSSKRVLPEKALAVGYRFMHPEIEPALRSILA